MVVASARRGLAVELAACDVGGEHVSALASDLSSESVLLESFPISGRSEPLARWGVSLPMIRHLWKSIPRFDIVHVHVAWSVATLVSLVRARIARVPTALTLHETFTDFDIDVSRSRWRTGQKRILGALVVRLADILLFTSEIERRDSSIAGKARARVVALPVVDEQLSQRPQTRSSSDSLRVGFLGRLHPKKNLPALIDAIARCDDVKLIVAGTGPPEQRDSLREKVRALGLDSKVSWLGFVNGRVKSDFLSGIDVLAMPSFYECFGIAAVEAMEAGVPVIVSDTVGIAAAVRDHEAGIVTGIDAESLTAAIMRFRDDPGLRSSCADGATRAAREEFSLGRFGREIDAVYDELATRGDTQ